MVIVYNPSDFPIVVGQVSLRQGWRREVPRQIAEESKANNPALRILNDEVSEPSPAEPEPEQVEAATPDVQTEKPLEDMLKDDLITMANGMDIDTDGMLKAEIITAIEAAQQ